MGKVCGIPASQPPAGLPNGLPVVMASSVPPREQGIVQCTTDSFTASEVLIERSKPRKRKRFKTKQILSPAYN